MSENNTRCNYCGRTLYKQVSEKYFVCSQKCKRLIKNNTYIETVDSLVLRVNSTKWSKVDDLNKKVDVNKFPAIKLARMVLNTSGSLGVVFNAAKEIALDRFILKDIKFSSSNELWYSLNVPNIFLIIKPIGILNPGEQNCLSSLPLGSKSTILKS